MWTRWLGAGCLCVSSAVAADEQRVTPEAFLAANPGCRVHLDSGGVSRIYGEPLARGAAPRRSLRQSAESFLIAYAPLLGVQRDELIERGPFPGGQHEIPLMYDPQQGRYRFSSLHYAQAVEGIPVFRSRLTLLLRNEPSHPVVLAATNLRELGEYRLPAPGVDAAAVRDRFRSTLPPETTLGPPRTVIWAGTREAPAAPRLAVEVIVRQGSLNDPGSFGQWLTVIDADSGATLYQEDQVLSAEITGSVSGMATSELGADFCAPRHSCRCPTRRSSWTARSSLPMPRGISRSRPVRADH